ncbi:hypothetical protein FE204_03000 [Bacillus subtilis]|nr:hypothetical protein BsLM_3186 [Bacillus sp. LM 4-2]MBR0007041.1 hypothetical protein [Bacillus subtilis]NDK01028.1 hypothetical protein [Bacillus subtilis subsp. subtilis]QAR94054.1 hypothetical protein EQI87_16730 [Bacillus subtilis]QAS09304.1 hypothetical protein EQI48_16825 [Bacillus subtilis]
MLDFSLTSHPLPFIMIVVVCENQQQRTEAKKQFHERNVLYTFGGVIAFLQDSMPHIIRQLILLIF